MVPTLSAYVSMQVASGKRSYSNRPNPDGSCLHEMARSGFESSVALKMEEKEKARWKKIAEIHNQTKKLFLLAEELQEQGGFKTFIQPIKEHRDALEHIVRAKADEIGDKPVPFGFIGIAKACIQDEKEERDG